MDLDLNAALTGVHDHARKASGDLPVAHVVQRARRRRTLVRSGYGAVGAGTVAALVLGGIALADRPEPLPPAVTTSSPAPQPSVSESAEAVPSEAPWAPNLTRCGLAGSTWDETTANQDAPVWLGNYWGPDAVTSAAEWTTLSDAIWGQDLGGRTMTVEVLDAVVAPLLGQASDFPRAVGPVVAVLGAQLDPFDLALSSGSEGGGGGSHASVGTPLTLALCDAATALPDGEYVTFTRYRLTVGGEQTVVYGESYQRIGEAPSLVSTLGLPTTQPIPLERYELDLGRCAQPTDDLAQLVSSPMPEFFAVGGVASGYSPHRSGEAQLTLPAVRSAWIGSTALGNWPRAEASRLAVLDAVVAAVTPGEGYPANLEFSAAAGQSGPVVGLMSQAVSPWDRVNQDETTLPITWCDGSTTVPDGLYAVYLKVQENVSGTDDAPWSTTGVYWTVYPIAVGEAAWPYGNWPY